MKRAREKPVERKREAEFKRVERWSVKVVKRIESGFRFSL